MNRGLWLKMLVERNVANDCNMEVTRAEDCIGKLLPKQFSCKLRSGKFISDLKNKKSVNKRRYTPWEVWLWPSTYIDCKIVDASPCDTAPRDAYKMICTVWFLSSSGCRIKEALKDIDAAQKCRWWQKLYDIAIWYWTELSSNRIQTYSAENVNL